MENVVEHLFACNALAFRNLPYFSDVVLHVIDSFRET